MSADPPLPEALLEAVYDAALDPALWPRALSLIGAEFRGAPTQLSVWDLERGTIPLAMAVGFAPDVWNTAARFATPDTNPTLALAMRIPLHAAIDQGAELGIDRFRASEIYADLYRPQGHMPLLGTVVTRSDSAFAGFALMRRAHWRQADRRDLARATRISRHLGRAVALARLVEWQSPAVPDLEAALYRVDRPVLLLSADGEATWLNASAERMTAAGRGLSLRGGRLVAAAPADDRPLADAVARAAHGGDAVTTIGRGGDLPPVTVRLSPLSRTQARGHARILAQVDAAPVRFDAARAVELFGLTPAEARIGCDICSHPGELAEAGRRLGVSVNTVKTLLQRVYDKTEVRSRAELTMLFARTVATGAV